MTKARVWAGLGVIMVASLWLGGCWEAEVDATRQRGPTEVDWPSAWYSFSDPTFLGQDRSGNQWNALAVNLTGLTDPVRGPFARFDTSTLILQPPIQSDFTITLWLRTTELGPDQLGWTSGPRIVDGDVSGVHLDFGLGLSLDKLAYGIGDPNDATLDATSLKSQASVVDGTWHHVAITRDTVAEVCQIYVDGLFDSDRAATPGTLTLPRVLTLGDLGNTSPVSPALKADLSDVRFYDRALSPAGIAFLATP